MADSDDDYHRRGAREKFSRERSDYAERSRQRDYDYDRRGVNYARADYANGGGGSTTTKRSSSSYRRGDEGGNSSSSTAKRPRIDSTSDSYDPVLKSTSDESASATSPVLMTFKRFLSTQDDSISDEEAIAKYSEYKLEFKRQELRKFFMAHKDEQWFRLKYHPEESAKRKEEQNENIHRRLAIFEELYNSGKITDGKLRVDADCAANIIRIMDTLVVKLEGGTNEDAMTLEEEKIDDESVNELNSTTTTTTTSSTTNTPTTTTTAAAATKSQDGEDKSAKSVVADGEEKKEKEENDSQKGGAAAANNNNNNNNNNNDDGAISDSDGEKKPEEPVAEVGQRKKMLLHKTSSIFLRNIAPNITIQEIETVCKRFPGFLRVGLAEPLPERKFYRRGWISFRRDVNIKEICWNLNGVRIRDCDLGAIINRDLARRVRTVNAITAHKQIAQNDLRQAAKLTALYDKKAGLYQRSEGEQEQEEEVKRVDDGGGAGADVVTNVFELVDPIAKSLNPLLKDLTDFLIEEASAEEEELLGLSNGSTSEQDQKVAFQRDDALLAKLDAIIIYLRIVHSIDFYNHGEYPNEDFMPNRCGMIHVRGDMKSSTSSSSCASISQCGFDEATQQPLLAVKFINEFMSGFNKRLEAALLTQITLDDRDLINLGKKDPEKEVEAFITANCVELAKDKWLCPLSGKKFKGPEFIRKHLLSKHSERLDEVRQEAEFFNNYLADAKRPQNADVKTSTTTATRVEPKDEPPSRREREPEPERVPPAASARSGGQTAGPTSYSERGGGGGGRGGGNYGYGGGGGRYGTSSSSSYNNRSYNDRVRYWGGDASGGGGARRERDPRDPRDPREPVTYKDLDAPEDIF